MHLAPQSAEALDISVQARLTQGRPDWYEQMGREQQPQKVCGQHHWLLPQICLALTDHPEENREGARGAQAIPQGAYPQGAAEWQCGGGGKFTNAHMKELLDDLHIKHITSLPYKPSSNGQVECLNRTIKGMMEANNLRRYLDVMPKIVENYNNTYHTTIKSTLAVVLPATMWGWAWST